MPLGSAFLDVMQRGDRKAFDVMVSGDLLRDKLAVATVKMAVAIVACCGG